MKKLFFLILILLSGTLINSQTSKEKLMPVTTSSKAALSLYNQAMKYLDDVKLDNALATFKKALKEDSDFFMANYQLSFFYLLNRVPDDFEKYSDAAINCKARLSDGEELLKSALDSFKDGHMNVIELGKKIVDMYPGDPNSYSNLAYFQSLAGDSASMVETLQNAIKVSANPATFYNQLGYAYLTLKQNDKALEAFDRYIELDPKNPNVYDSKGDYYMYIGKYDKAYDSYIKAFGIDPTFSRDKADIASRLYEQTEGKKLDIISM